MIDRKRPCLQRIGDRVRMCPQQECDHKRLSPRQESRGSGERGQPTVEAVGKECSRILKPRQGRSNRSANIIASIVLLWPILGCHSTQLPDRWMIPKNASTDVAPIHFHFPKPIEGYSGKVTTMRGLIQFGKGHHLSDARGWFEVDVKNVTMGEDALDESVRNNFEFLYSQEFPTSRFEFQSVDSSAARMTATKPIEGFLDGNFTLKGVSIPLRARAMLSPRRRDDGQWHLDLTADFSLEQLREVFHIAGPGGESEPAGNRMLFEVKTTLVPDVGLSLCEFR